MTLFMMTMSQPSKVRSTSVADLPMADDFRAVGNDAPWFALEPDGGVGYQTARKANGNHGVPPGGVVRLEFIGYDVSGEPEYVFQWQQPPQVREIPLHDHRDDFNGGFSLSVYHPGTGLPQQPFHP